MPIRQRDDSFKPMKVTIKTSDGSVFRGSVNMGPRERASDLFTQDDPDGIIAPFVILFDVSESSDKEFIAGKRVYFINRRHIVWVRPDDERKATKGEK
jgi:hypothetical protein